MTDEPRLRRAWTLWIRLLLLAFPPSFRRQMSADLAHEYGTRAPQTFARFVPRAASAAIDLVRAGLGARLDNLRACIDWPAGRAGAGLGADLRYGCRMLVRRPAYGATIVLTLALASGLAAAVFGLFDATLVRPLPFPDGDRLISIGSRWTNFDHAAVSIPEYLDYRRQARTLDSIAAWRHVNVNLAGGGGPERVPGAAVTASFFDVLGVRPALGRVFTAAEDVSGGEPVAVLAYGIWQRRFGGDPSLVGRTVSIDDRAVTITGIMPSSFRFPAADTDIWLPLRVNPAAPGNRGAHNRRVIARLRQGVTLEAVRDELAAIGRGFARDHPEDYPEGSGWGVSVDTLRRRLVGDVDGPLRMLFAAAFFVLLIATANISGLMLAGASERRTEFAARAALGASRLRLVRQVVVEGAAAGVTGGALGLPVAELLLRALRPGLPPAVSHPGVLALDPRVLAFALGVTGCAAGLASGYAAWHATRAATADALRSGGRTQGSLSARRVRAMLVAGELALALLLLVGAGLSFRSLTRLLDVNPGLAVSNVTTARLSLPSSRYATGRDTIAFYQRLIDSLETAPGVLHAGAVSVLPLSGSNEDVNFGVEGHVPPAPGVHPNAQARFVAGDYFRALDIPLVRGRLFENADHSDAPFVAIVSAALARKYWPGVDPVGRRMKLWSLDDEGPWRTVVGVVGDIRHAGLDGNETPLLYLPVSQFPQRTLTLVVRAGHAEPLGRLVQERVRTLDPAQPIFDVRTMEEWLDRSTAQPRFSLAMLAVFASAALTLAALGVYGIMAYTVARQARELGIRVALGARPRDLMRRVMARGLILTAAGLAMGLAAAWSAARYFIAFFYGIEPLEPLVYAGAAAVLGLVALAACAVPARRILQLDPAGALRAE